MTEFNEQTIPSGLPWALDGVRQKMSQDLFELVQYDDPGTVRKRNARERVEAYAEPGVIGEATLVVEVDFEAEPLARVPDQRSAVTYQETLGALDMRSARPRVLPVPFGLLISVTPGASSFGVAKRSTIETEQSAEPFNDMVRVGQQRSPVAVPLEIVSSTDDVGLEIVEIVGGLLRSGRSVV